MEKLKLDAHDKLTIGANKDIVVQFFAEHGLPLSFVQGEATGTIHVPGCAPVGCGSNDALLGLQVKVNDAGTVIAEPLVGAIYTNCL